MPIYANRCRLLASVILLGLSSLSEATPIPGPVQKLFDVKCADCHHPDTDDEYPYLHPKSTLEELIEEEALVPGKPDESAIIKRINLADGHKRRMPKSRGKVGDDSYSPPLTDAEKKILVDWVTALGAPSTPVVKVESTVALTKQIKKAQTSLPKQMPSGVHLDEKVLWIFDTHCSACHTGDYEPELHGGINLSRFFTEKDSDGKQLAAESIVERALRQSDASGRMPKSKGEVGQKSYRPSLNDTEKEVLEKWLEAGRPKAVKRELVSNLAVIDTIFKDLRELPEAHRKFYRYFTFNNLYNIREEDGSAAIPDLDPHRAALSKLINSLSMNAKITRPKAIDSVKTVYRIDLRHYNWDASDWHRVESYYPYGLKGINQRQESLIRDYTGTNSSFVRADWFVFASAQPPLYDEMIADMLKLELPAGEADYLSMVEHSLGFNRNQNLQAGHALRAGFQFSGVSQANRLIERHEIANYPGAYWISYDFTPLNPKRTQDLKMAPLGPPEAHLSSDPEHAFEHDGGEVVFNLPNGLQAYLLTTAKGKRLQRAPIEIVQDSNRQDSVIINGISCMGCHDQGIKPAIRAPLALAKTLRGMTDEIGPIVLAADTLNFKETQLLKKLYAPPAKLQSVIKEDFERFLTAEHEATADLANSTEPIVGLYNEFKSPVTANKLASEFGLTRQELMTLLEESATDSSTLSVIASSLKRGLPLRRENLLREYLIIAAALGYELAPFTPLGYEDFGGDAYARLIAHSDAYLEAFEGQTSQLAKLKTSVLHDRLKGSALNSQSSLLPGGGKLKLSIQPILKVGQTANLEVVATRDTHIRVYHYSSDQHITELYPGNTKRSTFRPRNKKLTISWTTTKPGGAEQVIVYSSKGGIKNVAKGTVTGDFLVFKKDQLLSPRGMPRSLRGIPMNIKASEEGHSLVPEKVTQSRIGYFLHE